MKASVWDMMSAGARERYVASIADAFDAELVSDSERAAETAVRRGAQIGTVVPVTVDAVVSIAVGSARELADHGSHEPFARACVLVLRRRGLLREVAS